MKTIIKKVFTIKNTKYWIFSESSNEMFLSKTNGKGNWGNYNNRNQIIFNQIIDVVRI